MLHFKQVLLSRSVLRLPLRPDGNGIEINLNVNILIFMLIGNDDHLDEIFSVYELFERYLLRFNYPKLAISGSFFSPPRKIFTYASFALFMQSDFYLTSKAKCSITKIFFQPKSQIKVLIWGLFGIFQFINI